MPEIGPTAEVFAALFTGATAFLIWRGMQPLKPEIETEVLGANNGRVQVGVTIRNHDHRFTLVVEEIRVGRRDVPIDPVGPSHAHRIAPRHYQLLAYFCRGTELPKEIICTMRFANRRAKRYRVKLTRPKSAPGSPCARSP